MMESFKYHLLLTVLALCSVGINAQPTEIDIDLKGDTTEETQIGIKIPQFTERPIRLVPGRNFSFSCTAPSGFQSSKAWYKINTDGSLDAVTRDLPSSTTETEVYVFQTELNDFSRYSLRFQNFSSELNGKYICKAPVSNKTLIISDSNPSVISGVHKIVVNLNTIQTTNRVFVSGLPLPSSSQITWTHNGNVFNPNVQPLNIVFFSGNREILFPSIKYLHEGMYAATVSSANGNSTDQFYLDVQDRPLLVMTMTPSQPTLGDTVNLTCTDSKGDPIPNFSWTYNGSSLPTDRGYTNSTVPLLRASVGVLTIPNVNFSHIGSYKCEARNSAGYDTEIERLEVFLPSPSVPTLAITSPNTIKYSGGKVNITCQSTVATSQHYTGTISANITWKRNGIEIPTDQNDRLLITQSNNGLTFTSILSLLAISAVEDSGNYSCEVVSVAGDYKSATIRSSTSVPLTVQVPTTNVLLTPLSEEVPNFQPYNNLHLTCTVTLPQDHTITPHFYWYLSSNTLLTNGQGGYTIVNGSANSTLSFSATEPGVFEYTCSVLLLYPGIDPNMTLTRMSAITVGGPRDPHLPTSVTVGNIDYNSSVIQWTVPSVSYTPENYFVRYGTSENNLNLMSESLHGVTSFKSQDVTLSITLKGLAHDQMYYYSVYANNSHGNTNSVVKSFKTQRLALVQFMAGPFRGCHNGRIQDASEVVSFMNQKISQAITSSCSCSFPLTNLINGQVHCTAANSDQLLYRVYIVSTTHLTSKAIVQYATKWVQSGPQVTSGVAKVTFISSCPTNISSQQDPICTMPPVTTSTDPTTDGLKDSFGSNTDILIAVVAGAVILLEAVIIVILFCALCHQNSKIRYLLKKRSNYGNVRRSSSIAASEGHSEKWKGDAYVTTECPAYLSAYKPKELEDFEDELAIPAIYDTIDHVNGRGLPGHLQAPPPLPPAPESIIQQDSTSDDDNTGSSMMS